MKQYSILILVVVLALLASAAAQVDPRVQPTDPLKSGQPLPNDATQPAATDAVPVEQVQRQQVRPDTVTLSGAEYLGLGEMGEAKSFFSPSFRFAAMADTDPGNTPGSSQLTSTNYIMGELALQRIYGRYDTRLQYNGGAAIYAPNGSNLNTSFHEFGVAQRINFHKGSLLFADDFSYLPYSSFGFTGIVGMGNYSSVLPNYRPQFMPGETILSGRAPRFTNTAVGELDFDVTRRSTVTLAGSYGLLNFLDPQFIDGKQYNAVAGWQYALSRRDTIGLRYGLSMFRFDNGIKRTVDDHVAELAYGRRITGRLAFEVAAGPRYNIIHDPILPDDKKLMVGGNALLRYAWHTADMTMQYVRHTAMGSGLFIGTENQTAQWDLRKQLSRSWRLNLDAGYSHDGALRRQLSLQPAHSFDSGFGGGSLSRKLGNWSDMFVSYSYQHRTDACSPFQTAAQCSSFPPRHVVGIGLDWGFKPIRID